MSSSTATTAAVLWMHTARARPAWYAQSAAERTTHEDRFARVRDVALSEGATTTGVFDVRGQSDYSVMEAWTFPDTTAAFAHWAALVDAGYAQWFAFANTLGTEGASAERSGSA